MSGLAWIIVSVERWAAMGFEHDVPDTSRSRSRACDVCQGPSSPKGVWPLLLLAP